jgi:hypothetical protein
MRSSIEGGLAQISGNQEEENSQGYDPCRPNLKAAIHAAALSNSRRSVIRGCLFLLGLRLLLLLGDLLGRVRRLVDQGRRLVVLIALGN